MNNPLRYTDPSGHFWEWGEEFWNSLKGLLGQTWQDITDAFSQLGGWLGFGKTATVTVGPLMDEYGNAYGGGSYGGGSGNLDNSREASHDRFCMEHLKNPDTPYNEPRNIDTINKLINEFGIDKKGANIQYKEKWFAFGSVDFNDGLVTISSSAFRSRSFLISTIDHEVVTHYGEQYYKGYVCPSNNEQCSWMQEYQAVKRQLEKAVDYGSTPDEIKFYECRKNRYYNGLTDENKLRVNKGEYYPEYKWRKK